MRIDLSSFYTSLGDLPEQKLKIALVEFFGVLARANRKYIDGNPSREKVFLQLLKTLRELFVLVSERDMVNLRIEKSEKEVEALVEALHAQSCSVQQGLGTETQLEFPQPRVRRLADGEIEFVHEAPQVKICEGHPGALRLELKSAANDRSTADVADDELQAVTLCPREGLVIWEATCAVATS